VAINSRGVIAGISNNGLVDPLTGIPAFVATLWKNGDVTNLGTLGGSFSLANFITDRGEAVGGAQDTIADPFNFGDLLGLPSGTEWHATVWMDGAMRDLGTLEDGANSFALSANEHGQVTGMAFTNSIINLETGYPTVAPFFWENGRMTNIGGFGGVTGFPGGINSRGQVTGISAVTRDQSIRQLARVPPHPLG
jgi:uncharacterized membrane protein